MRLSWRSPRAAKVPDPVVEFPCTAFRNSLFAVAGNLSTSDRRRRGFPPFWPLRLGRKSENSLFFPQGNCLQRVVCIRLSHPHPSLSVPIFTENRSEKPAY